MELKKVIDSKIENVKKIRKKLNENAELAFKEFNTQKIILEVLKENDIYATCMAQTGVVGLLNKGDNCIAVRADMDALPINGVSHACGHDYHMSVVLGAAMVLKEMGIDKCVKFIFQPAEEGVGGAVPMINEGVLKNPEVKNMIGFHVWPGVPVGKIEVAKGPSMASADDFYIKFIGAGGHAAMPYKCKNPIYPAMDFIQSMNNKSKIETDPLNSHVITFSSINAGNVPNVIADEAQVLGTVRTFDEKLRKKIYEDIMKVSKISAEKYDCKVEVDYKFQYPPLVNDDEFTDRFTECVKEALGDENVLPLIKTFPAEDFAFFAEKVPSVHFRLGITDDVRGLYPLHSPKFDAAEEALYCGIYSICSFIMNL